jgi:hypothetical protein
MESTSACRCRRLDLLAKEGDQRRDVSPGDSELPPNPIERFHSPFPQGPVLVNPATLLQGQANARIANKSAATAHAAATLPAALMGALSKW